MDADVDEGAKVRHVRDHAFQPHPWHDMLRALAQNGGLLGAAYYAGMLDDDFRGRMSQELWKIETAGVELIGQVPMSRLVDHIEHAATVAGIDHVGLGCDYDSVGLKVPEGLEHIGKTPNLIAALKDRGFSDADVANIMGGNALRVMQQAEAISG